MTDYEFQVDGFMLYCTSKNLSMKTLASYEQSLKLFCMYIQKEFEILVNKVQTNYIKHLKERGKYTVSVEEKKNKLIVQVTELTIGKKFHQQQLLIIIRNIKVFFNWLYHVEKEIRKNALMGITLLTRSLL